MRQGVVIGQWYAIQFLMIEKNPSADSEVWPHSESNRAKLSALKWILGSLWKRFCFLILPEMVQKTINTNHLFDTPVPPKLCGSSSYSRDPKSPCFTKPKTTVKRGSLEQPLTNVHHLHEIRVEGWARFLYALVSGMPHVTWVIYTNKYNCMFV